MKPPKISELYHSNPFKNRDCFFYFIILFLLFSLFSATTQGVEEVIVRPVDNGTPLKNPGMGWVFHHYDNSIDGYGEPFGQGYDGREFPGMTTVYLRLSWSHLEPQEGVFNWSVLDSIIQRYARAGMKFSLCLTVFEGDPKQGCPEWLREANCPGYMVNPFDIVCWEPDYSAPFFLAKMKNFLMAAGKKYDGHPDLAFVDVGTIGIWGEGNPIDHKYPISVLKEHIDIHKEAFPNSLLVGADDWAGTFRNPDDPVSVAIPCYQDDPSITQFVFDQGLTLRDNSINVYPDPKWSYSDYRVAAFWSTRIIILEMGHYDYAKQVGAWGGERYLQAVEDYHASYTSIHANPFAFLKENGELIDQMNQRLGYRLLPSEIRFPEKINKKEGITITSTWANLGAAPCYGGGHPIWTLLDSHGNIGAVFTDESFDVRSLEPGANAEIAEKTTIKSSFPVTPKLRPGEYTLCVSVGDKTGKPIITLPLPALSDSPATGPDDAKRHPLGKIVVE